MNPLRPDRDEPELHWSIGAHNRSLVPQVIIHSLDDRAWVGALVQGEGSIGSTYVRLTNSTSVNLDLRMTDWEPVFRFAELSGLPRPKKPQERPNRWQPLWRKNLVGVRAIRVLREIEPFLVGQKLREAHRAFEFFDPTGYHKGHHSSSTIWPPTEFPFRRHPTTMSGAEEPSG